MENGQRKTRKYLKACCYWMSKYLHDAFTFNHTSRSAVVFKGIEGTHCPYCGKEFVYTPGLHDNFLYMFLYSTQAHERISDGSVYCLTYTEWRSSDDIWANWMMMPEDGLDEVTKIAEALGLKGWMRRKVSHPLTDEILDCEAWFRLGMIEELEPVMILGPEYEMWYLDENDTDPAFHPHSRMWEYKWSLSNPPEDANGD